MSAGRGVGTSAHSPAAPGVTAPGLLPWFGIRWNRSQPTVTRKADQRQRRRADADESDVYVLPSPPELTSTG
jgi:hypothetical protein